MFLWQSLFLLLLPIGRLDVSWFIGVFILDGVPVLGLILIPDFTVELGAFLGGKSLLEWFEFSRTSFTISYAKSIFDRSSGGFIMLVTLTPVGSRVGSFAKPVLDRSSWSVFLGEGNWGVYLSPLGGAKSASSQYHENCASKCHSLRLGNQVSTRDSITGPCRLAKPRERRQAVCK